jgi:F-type H+-transporting ATPase subunit beta
MHSHAECGGVANRGRRFKPQRQPNESFRGLAVEGEYDHLPEQAFYMVGGIEEVEKTQKRR